MVRANSSPDDIITASIATNCGFASNVWAEVASHIVAGSTGDKVPFWATRGTSGTNLLAVASIEADNSPPHRS
ncbi:Uu.00g082720.m01.CDS01 [Anthostomella pinea]|uniref:Uu.00g082720.m01.CDS01 n=1 Tax=Anthostomella pinea TaxID=933095 RepID=A0AAI8VLE3_9PEZI|nr:Uu.00g082720.m01.CDS01 [Anthostomella pinea]